MALKLPNLCPLLLLVKVTCRQGRALESEEGKMIGSGLFGYASEEGSWAFGLGFVEL
jgi:hypothetical protein